MRLWSAENDVLVPQARYAEAVRLALAVSFFTKTLIAESGV